MLIKYIDKYTGKVLRRGPITSKLEYAIIGDNSVTTKEKKEYPATYKTPSQKDADDILNILERFQKERNCFEIYKKEEGYDKTIVIAKRIVHKFKFEEDENNVIHITSKKYKVK